MSNSTAILTQKLSQIRESKPMYWVWRHANRMRIIPTMTVLLMCSILLINTFSTLSYTTYNSSDNVSVWVGYIKQIVQDIDNYDQKTIDELEVSMKQSILPLVQPLGLSRYADTEIEGVFHELSNLLKLLEPLGEYTISSEGLTNPFNSSRFVTDDLNNIFVSLEPILNRMEKHWNSFQWLFWVAQPILSDNADRLSQFVTLILKLGKQVIKYKDSFLSILGGDNTKRYVIVTQNTAESRPSGGYMGSYTPVDVSKGQIDIGESKPISEVSGSLNVNYINNMIPLYYYSNEFNQKPSNTSHNSNTSACFSDTAKRMIDILSRSRVGYHVDGVIYLNPGFIDTLIPAGTTFKINNEIINASGLFDYIDRSTGVSTGETLDFENPKSIIDDIGREVINKMSSVIQQMDPFELITRVLISFHARHIQMYISHAEIQSILELLNFGGNQTCQHESNLPIITPYFFGLADKRDRDLTHTFIINTERVWGGVRYKVTHRYNSPNQFASNRDISIRPVHFAGLQIPSSALSIHSSSDQNLDLKVDQSKFNQFFELSNLEFYSSQEDQQVLDSYRYLEQSIVFNQSDGSMVVGMFVEDEATTDIHYEFTLPTNDTAFVFYPQAGMENLKISLGDGARFYYDRIRTIMTDDLTIQLGVPILTK